MRTWCGKSCLFELALMLVWVTGNASQVRAQEGTDDASLSAPFPRTVYGYRGSAGTIGVLAAAAFVIPAGIISIAYLLYVYNCKRDNDNSDEKITGNSREWSEISPGNVRVANGLWSQEGEVQADMSTSFLLESALGPGSTGDMERLSLISRQGSSASMTDGGSFAVDGLDVALVITPERETRVHAGKVIGAIVNGDPTNMVEVHVTAEDACDDLDGNIVEFPEGGKIANSGDFGRSAQAEDLMSGQPASCFREAVHMNVVNEVHVELRLTNGEEVQSKNDNEENYMSEVKFNVPGIGGGPADSGRPFKADVNNTGWF